jgi:hypothetical protein
MKVLDFVAGAAFVTALIALPFSWYGLRRHTIRSLLVFGIPLLAFFCACSTSQEIAQGEVAKRLDTVSGKYQIYVNGTAAPNPKEVLMALKTLHWVSAHHSNPTKRISIEVSDDFGHIVLLLARDSGDPKEYWVFYPKYYITTYNEIGRIVTPVFDKY